MILSDTQAKAMPTTMGRDLAILVFVVVACALPFLGQPFHMDDAFYMDMARNAQVSPLFPHDTPYMYQEIFFEDMGSHSHPPLQIYFLAAVMRLFGEGAGTEWIYHGFSLFYPILGVVAFYFLASLFVSRPIWPSLMLACSPLFLVMQHTLMTDIPMLAFWLASIASFLWAVRNNSAGLYATSTLFQFAAMFTSYQSFALVPLLGYYQLRKGRGLKGWIALLIPPVMIGGWFLLSCLHYERLLFGITLDFMQSRDPLALPVLLTKLLSVIQYQGWLIVFPFFLLYLFARGMKGRALLLVFLLAAGVIQLRIEDYRWLDKAIFLVGFAAGFFIMLEMAKLAVNAFRNLKMRPDFERVEGQFLSLWYWGVLFYCVFILTEGSARYVLPLVPPFIICFFRILEISEVAEYRLPPRILSSAMLASGSLVVSLLFGLLLSHSDQQFARIYPRAANQFSRIADSVKSYCVGEWGFRYYMGQLGILPMPADQSLISGGSFIAVPELALPHDLPADLRSMMIPVETFRYKPRTNLRIFDAQTPAGFYSSGWGLIPFSFSNKTLEQIEVHQVSFMVELLPWAAMETSTGIKPWPGYLELQGQTHLAILAKTGTRISYKQPIHAPTKLELLCGVSADSYTEGSADSFRFEIRSLDAEGNILEESQVTVQPGMNPEDRAWRSVHLVLEPGENHLLDFGYFGTGSDLGGVGAFAQAILVPAVEYENITAIE